MQKQIYRLLSIIYLGFSLTACMSPDNPKEDQEKQTKVQTNTPVQNEGMQKLPENSQNPTNGNQFQEDLKPVNRRLPFTVHIPADHKPEAIAPVIFIFDPHARGKLPINKYSDLADEFGFVLVGSNESMNNQPIEDGLKYYHEMRSEISGDIRIDEERIYTMGFSGGARVAVSIAIQESEVQGVVGCGAGFPAVRQMPKPDFYYFGMVGYEDFNMGELINNDRLLTRSGFENELVIFDGGHDWPSQEIMREAFLALEIDYMSKSGDQNQPVISQTIDYYNVAIDEYTSENRYFDAAEMADRAASVLGSVTNVDDFKSQMRSFKNNPDYRNDLSAMVKSMEKETGLQNNFIAAFQDKDIEWWQAEIIALKAPVKDVFEQRLNKRLESFIGLMAYMQSTKSIAEDNLDFAKKSLDIYRLTEPLNPEHFYLGAVVSMKEGDEEAAGSYLEQAMVLGFNNIERIRQEPAFDDMERKEEIIELIQGAL